MKSRHLAIAALSALAHTAGAGPVTAYVVDDDDGLHLLDLQTAQTQFIGTIDQPYVYELALSDDGRLFAQRDAVEQFFEIDPATAAGGQGIDLPDFVRGIDFWQGRLIAHARDEQHIVEIDPTDGSFTTITPGSLGYWTRHGTAGPGSTYYTLDRDENLHAVDLASGQNTTIGTVTTDSPIRGIDFVNGTLYAVSYAGTIYSIDPLTGGASAMGSIGFEIGAFAAVPAPGSLALLVPLVLTARRRRTA